MNTEYIILGAGGHARVVADALLALGQRVRGFIDSDPARHGALLLGVPVLGGDDVLESVSPSQVLLVNGIGSAGSMETRRRVYAAAKARGFSFATVVHPAALVAPSARLSEGVQVLARAVVQPLAVVGENSIVNTGAIVEHDVIIGSHVHVSPGCVLAGEVRVGDRTHIGVGAVVIQQMIIGSGSFVAAGAVVVANVAESTRVIGVPARVQN
jgi:sugar O-acyltransferase (sialic acid O-acetyltransferase NeuD family)